MRHTLSALFGLIITFAMCQSVTASSLITGGQNNGLNARGTHTLSLQCHVNDTAYMMSRLTVLKVKSKSERDIGITTGHGLIDKTGNKLTQCVVRDFDGNVYKVRSVKIADDYAPGTPTDWAVVIFDKVRNTSLVRYALAAPLKTDAFDDLAENKLPVKFSSARGLPGSGQSCAIIPRRFAGFDRVKYEGLVPHNCKAISGQSGAPISVTRAGENVIMGFHVGHAFLLRSRYHDGPTRHGYMRAFDDHLRKHVNTIIMDMSQPETRQ